MGLTRFLGYKVYSIMDERKEFYYRIVARDELHFLQTFSVNSLTSSFMLIVLEVNFIEFFTEGAHPLIDVRLLFINIECACNASMNYDILSIFQLYFTSTFLAYDINWIFVEIVFNYFHIKYCFI